MTFKDVQEIVQLISDIADESENYGAFMNYDSLDRRDELIREVEHTLMKFLKEFEESK